MGGQNLKIALLRRGLRQRAVAKAINVHETTISAIVNGRLRPTAKQAEAISRLLNIPARELFDQGKED